MGSITRAHCPCGYERQMFLGGGMQSFATPCNFPLFCVRCGILFEANLFEGPPACPQCGEAAIPYDDPRTCARRGNTVFSWNARDALGRELTLTDGEYICPQCGNTSLSFAAMGLWD